MSVADIMNELPRLTAEQRRTLLQKLLEMEPQFQETAPPYFAVNLRDRGIDARQAADLRARLKTFAEDWERPEAAIYDEDSSR
jgi:hypothetical protein